MSTPALEHAASFKTQHHVFISNESSNLPTLPYHSSPYIYIYHTTRRANHDDMTTLPGIDGNLPLPAGSFTTPQYFLGIEGSANKVCRMGEGAMAERSRLILPVSLLIPSPHAHKIINDFSLLPYHSFRWA